MNREKVEEKKTKELAVKKKKLHKIVIVGVIIAIVIYVLTMIYRLIKEPTNIFMVENGKLYLEEDSVRLYYS